MSNFINDTSDWKTRFIKKFFLYIGLLAIAFLMVLPFLWMLSSSLKLDREVFQVPIQWIPATMHWENYVNIWKEIDFLSCYKNTVFLTLIVTFNSMLTSSLAAYALSKIKFPGRKSILFFYVMTMAIPFQAFVIPQYTIINFLGLGNSLWALVATQSFSPFGVFLIRQFYLGIPDELCESARIDGTSELGIFVKIMLPLSKPALSALCIWQFVFVWNDFLGPLVYLTSEKVKTIQLGMQKFITQYGSEYGLIMAAAVCALIPVIILYILLQKLFVQGIATTGLKG
jgi:multiple sugar transport system permease protein